MNQSATRPNHHNFSGSSEEKLATSMELFFNGFSTWVGCHIGSWRINGAKLQCWEGYLYCFLVGISRQVPVSNCDELPLKFEAICRYFAKHRGISVINFQSQNGHTGAIKPPPHFGKRVCHRPTARLMASLSLALDQEVANFFIPFGPGRTILVKENLGRIKVEIHIGIGNACLLQVVHSFKHPGISAKPTSIHPQ